MLASDQDEPILAQWQFGLGRALVWTADAEGAWSRDWASGSEDAFKRLWPQAVRWTMAAPAQPRTCASARHPGRGQRPGARRVLRRPEGTFRNHLQTVAEVALPDGSGQRVPVPQTGPGRYEGRFPLAGPGVYFVQVTQTDPGNGRLVARQTTGYALPHLPEYAVTPANRVLLERLAADTGGPLLRDPPGCLAPKPPRFGWRPQAVWPELLAGALVLFVADVAVRRLRLSRRDLAFLRSVPSLPAPRFGPFGRGAPGRAQAGQPSGAPARGPASHTSPPGRRPPLANRVQ